jgi:EpsI family protein
MKSRAFVAIVLMLATLGLTRLANARGDLPIPALDSLPYAVGEWTGVDASPLDPEIVRELSADSYITRTYAGQTGAPIGLYVVYYATERPGVSIHSPLNCLPGNGWEPLDVRTVALGEGAAGDRVRRMMIRKDRSQAIVFYWYAIHGRMVASEIASKAWLLADSFRLRRTDAALVRIVVPMTGAADDADARGMAFIRDLLPHLPLLWS